MRILIAALALLLLSPVAPAQVDGLQQIGDPVTEFLLRQQTLGNLDGAILTNLPLSAYEARRHLDSLAANAERLTRTDRVLLGRFRGERPGAGVERLHGALPWTRALYANGRDFLAVESDFLGTGEQFGVQLNPMANLAVGMGRQTASDDRPGTVTTWRNNRAIRASGHVGPNIFFETRIEEIQEAPVFAERAAGTMPRERRVRFLPLEAGQSAEGTLDYGRAMGVVGFRSRYFEVRFGRDRNRWGHGTGSLLLSDFAPAYDQLQLRTTFWRIQYVNLFTGMEASATAPSGRTLPRKFGTFHKLTFNATDRLQFEAFQSVIFVPDPESGRAGFSMAFLNPIIFFHQVEKDYNARGNFAVGAGASWIIHPGVRPYGQLMLTEFRARELFSDRGWWGNHWGVLAGLHLADLPLPNLDVRLEYSQVRPYTYSHHGHGSYTHFHDVLGHPAGQNFRDVAVFARYRPHPDVRVAVNAAYTWRGRDTDDENFGGDPLLSYNDRVRDFGVYLLQGVRQDQLLLEAAVGYEVLPLLFLEGTLHARMIDDAEDGVYRFLAPSLSLRWGLPFESRRY